MMGGDDSGRPLRSEGAPMLAGCQPMGEARAGL